MRNLIPLLIAGVFASLLIGWAVAFWYDRRLEERYREREDADGDE